jgi:hypothetical protein
MKQNTMFILLGGAAAVYLLSKKKTTPVPVYASGTVLPGGAVSALPSASIITALTSAISKFVTPSAVPNPSNVLTAADPYSASVSNLAPPPVTSFNTVISLPPAPSYLDPTADVPDTSSGDLTALPDYNISDGSTFGNFDGIY